MTVPAPFAYHEHRPSGALADVVLSFWAFDASAGAGEPLAHTVWPDGCASLAVAVVPGAPRAMMCVGATVEPRHLPVTPGARYFGVRFWPDTGADCTGFPAAQLRNAILPVPAAYAVSWSETSGQLAALAQVSDAWPVLLAWASALAQRTPRDLVVRQAIHAIAGAGGDVRVAALSASVGTSARTLQRRFSAATGLTLKEYARIRRMRTALVARLRRPGESWSALAAGFGYADQSHLIREFGALAGRSPREVEQLLLRITHHNVSA